KLVAPLARAEELVPGPLVFLLVGLQCREEAALQFALDQQVRQLHLRQELHWLELVPASEDLAQHLDTQFPGHQLQFLLALVGVDTAVTAIDAWMLPATATLQRAEGPLQHVPHRLRPAGELLQIARAAGDRVVQDKETARCPVATRPGILLLTDNQVAGVA